MHVLQMHQQLTAWLLQSQMTLLLPAQLLPQQLKLPMQMLLLAQQQQQQQQQDQEQQREPLRHCKLPALVQAALAQLP
jgi:hypothetical protein